jgi:hypothetical protein
MRALADRNILANQAYNAFSAFPEDALVRISPADIQKKGRVPKNGSLFFTIFQTFMASPGSSRHFSLNKRIHDTNWGGRRLVVPNPAGIVLFAECNRNGIESMDAGSAPVYEPDVEAWYRISNPGRTGLYAFCDGNVEALKGNRGWNASNRKTSLPSLSPNRHGWEFRQQSPPVIAARAPIFGPIEQRTQAGAHAGDLRHGVLRFPPLLDHLGGCQTKLPAAPWKVLVIVGQHGFGQREGCVFEKRLVAREAIKEQRMINHLQSAGIVQTDI